MNKLFVLLISAIICVAFLPQQTTVKGKVTDSNGNALSGVAVQTIPDNSTTFTNAKGVFTIPISDSTKSLKFSYVGFETKEVAINKQQNVHVVLNATNESLNDVVVTGYAKADKKMTTMEMRSYNYAPATALQGQVAGLAVYDKRRYQTRMPYNPSDDESYKHNDENDFKYAKYAPLSTFSIDVDNASYSNVRRFINNGNLPPVDAVRIEEMINYFNYDYPQPKGNAPVNIITQVSTAPWNAKHQLVQIALQAKKISTENLPASNFVFLIDVSGSMNEPNKLPLLISSLKMLIDNLRAEDKVAIVTYAGNAGVALPSTSAKEKEKIKDALNRLSAYGSTNGAGGIEKAYAIASENFIKKGNNRIILATDGDFNVGMSSDDDMEKLIEQKRASGIYLTVLGFGMGNYKDSKMETLADKGNGNYAYIDNIQEARKVLLNEFGGTMFTVAKDVKLQIEFNPQKVQAYRLVGYEDRKLNDEDFNNDKKDAGEMGAGQTVTAFYEIIPIGEKDTLLKNIDELKYQKTTAANTSGNELLTVKLRYKDSHENNSKLLTHVVDDTIIPLQNTGNDFRFAAAVAEFGMLLKHSAYKQNASYDNAASLAMNAKANDDNGYKAEFVRLVQTAKDLKGNEATNVVAPPPPRRVIPINPYLRDKKQKIQKVKVIPIVKEN